MHVNFDIFTEVFIENFGHSSFHTVGYQRVDDNTTFYFDIDGVYRRFEIQAPVAKKQLKDTLSAWLEERPNVKDKRKVLEILMQTAYQVHAESASPKPLFKD